MKSSKNIMNKTLAGTITPRRPHKIMGNLQNKPMVPSHTKLYLYDQTLIHIGTQSQQALDCIGTWLLGTWLLRHSVFYTLSLLGTQSSYGMFSQPLSLPFHVYQVLSCLVGCLLPLECHHLIDRRQCVYIIITLLVRLSYVFIIYIYNSFQIDFPLSCFLHTNIQF